MEIKVSAVIMKKVVRKAIDKNNELIDIIINKGTHKVNDLSAETLKGLNADNTKLLIYSHMIKVADEDSGVYPFIMLNEYDFSLLYEFF